METLAHHPDNPDEWIDLMNDVEGLVNLAVHQRIGFDEGTTDRIVEAFGSLSELKAVYELDRYVTDETLTQAGVRACWKNLLFKRLGGAPEYRMTAYNAPACVSVSSVT